MTEYRKIDAIVKDASICITIAPGVRPTTGFPEVADRVSLDTGAGYSMQVQATWISDDQETLRGIVTNGYYPSDEAKQIDIGAKVEFSRKKVGGIFKK